MPQFVLRFNLNDHTGDFSALAQALRRETGALITRLDAEQWVIPVSGPASGIERPVTAVFRGEEAALRAVRVWLDRLGVGDIDLIEEGLAAQMVFSRGIEARQQGRNQEALEWYDRTLAVNEMLGQAWSNRANVLVDLQQWDESEASYRRAIACDPADPVTRFNFGTFLLERGRYQEASYELREAQRLAPELEPAKQNLEILEKLLSSS